MSQFSGSESNFSCCKDVGPNSPGTCMPGFRFSSSREFRSSRRRTSIFWPKWNEIWASYPARYWSWVSRPTTLANTSIRSQGHYMQQRSCTVLRLYMQLLWRMLRLKKLRQELWNLLRCARLLRLWILLLQSHWVLPDDFVLLLFDFNWGCVLCKRQHLCKRWLP